MKGKREINQFCQNQSRNQKKIIMLRSNLEKEQERVNHLSEKLKAFERHKSQIDTNNNSVNQSNILLIQKISKINEQIDKISRHA